MSNYRLFYEGIMCIPEEFIELKNEILLGVQRSLTTAFLHQKTFGEFKNRFAGKSVVLVGAGPTLKYYESIKNAIYIGVNRTFLFKDIKFDYLFAIDKAGLETSSESYTQAFLDYIGNNCIKFVGDQNCGINYQIPEGKLNNTIRRYKTTSNLVPNKFTLNIDTEPLGNFYSVSFQAIQFILFTNPAKIYLVGMDSNVSTMGHFTGNNDTDCNKLALNTLKCIDNWKGLKDFKNTHYPDTEIISVNPVGLKGIFKDIYTEHYLLSENKPMFDKDFETFLDMPMKKYLEDLKFEKYFINLKKKLKNKKIVIYGTGTLFQSVFKAYDISELNIIALSDKKYTSVGKEFEGHITIPPQQICDYKPECILVALQEYENVINELQQQTQVEILPLVKKDY